MSLYPAHAKLASQPPEDNHRQEPRSPATATGVTRGQCGAGGSSQAGSSQGRTPFFYESWCCCTQCVGLPETSQMLEEFRKEQKEVGDVRYSVWNILVDAVGHS